jgi:acyl-CoA thioesterase-2
MPADLAALLAVLKPTPHGADVFVGESFDPGWGRLFGGQVFAQALAAATFTVAPDRLCHAVRADFLRLGDVTAPVTYQVERTRDGGSFSTRRVRAVQLGQVMLTLDASFHRQEPGLDHQTPIAPTVTPAEQLPPSRERTPSTRALDLRVVDPIDPDDPGVRAPVRRIWCRAEGSMEEDQRDHHLLLAYASDFHLLTTALQPHAMSWKTPGLQIATLNHSLWFHRPFRMDRWCLYEVDSPTAAGSRAMARGNLFDLEGRLVASSVQEGMVRGGDETGLS